VARSRVEMFEQIRKDRRVEGTSIRELAEFTSTEVVYGVTGTSVTGLPEFGVSP